MIDVEKLRKLIATVAEPEGMDLAGHAGWYHQTKVNRDYMAAYLWNNRQAILALAEREERMREALESLLRATDHETTPIVRRLARIQARSALKGEPLPACAFDARDNDLLALLVEVDLEMGHARTFIGSRERMHPDGVALYEQLHGKVRRALTEQKA